MVSLAFQQHMSREEDLLRVNMQRLLNGYSVCLGMAGKTSLTVYFNIRLNAS